MDNTAEKQARDAEFHSDNPDEKHIKRAEFSQRANAAANASSSNVESSSSDFDDSNVNDDQSSNAECDGGRERKRKLVRRKAEFSRRPNAAANSSSSNVELSDFDSNVNNEESSNVESISSCDRKLSQFSFRRNVVKSPTQFKLLYNSKDKLMPRAMQRMWTDQAEVFIVESTWGPYEPPALPDELSKQKTVQQLMSFIKEIFQDMELADDKQWKSCRYTEKLKEVPWRDNEKYAELRQKKNIGAKRTAIQAAFLMRPSLSNVSGRAALQNICLLLCEVMPVPYDDSVTVFNVGGGSQNWIGNCKIGCIYNAKKKHRMSGDQLKTLMNEESECEDTIRVPDFQICRSNMENFFVTGEVKTVREFESNQTSCRRQAWEQALAGLWSTDESYAILLTPKQAELYHLRITDPQPGNLRHLQTRQKRYSFIGDNGDTYKFDVEQLEMFMTDVLSIMHEKAVLFYNEQLKELQQD